ncbi:hypothetical protein [Streptosporangium roseum]|uniref:hypothetical protein n=1 Tax=Streptosporangium roseum TaxID=2001 RepID=UPI0004CD97CF|nr:hypothetical protein [Streptosporangium roseum]
MNQSTTSAAPIVERPDYNNANLLTFEVTWENGAVEQIKAHWMLRPSSGSTGLQTDHITFTGWYDGVHHTVLSARPDRVRCIRDLGLLPSLPDLGDSETVAELDEMDRIELGDRVAAAFLNGGTR